MIVISTQRYKIGDKVRIKQFDKPFRTNRGGSQSFVDYMLKHCGKTFTIVNTSPNKNNLAHYILNDTYFCWHEDWFEPVIEDNNNAFYLYVNNLIDAETYKNYVNNN